MLAIVLGWICLALILRAALMMCAPPWKPQLVGGTGAKLQSILKSVPLLWACPRGPLDFWSALHLLVFALQMTWQEMKFEEHYDFDRDELETELPGESTDGCPGRVSLLWLRSAKGHSPSKLADDAPIVLLCPGLNCYAKALPGTSIYTALLERPWRVAVFEKRGVSDNKLQSPAFHLFGHPSDLHTAVQHIESTYPGAPLYIVGVSSGNGLTASYASLYGGQVKSLRSVLLLVGGEDYNCAFEAPNATWLSKLVFDGVLLATTKMRFLKRNEKLLRAKDSAAYDTAMNSKTLQSCYDICMRHFSGYSDPSEAEKRINRFSGGCECLREIPVPFLYVCTLDDPVAPGGPRPEWLKVIKECENAAVALFPCGSHLGCYDSWRFTRWLDRLVIQWVDAFESTY
jgi:predicted alpha/beta-fold hydrolase